MGVLQAFLYRSSSGSPWSMLAILRGRGGAGGGWVCLGVERSATSLAVDEGSVSPLEMWRRLLVGDVGENTEGAPVLAVEVLSRRSMLNQLLMMSCLEDKKKMVMEKKKKMMTVMKKKTKTKKKKQGEFNFIAFAASARNPSRASPIINIAVFGQVPYLM